jgi:carboxyl-terminal processing protease
MIKSRALTIALTGIAMLLLSTARAQMPNEQPPTQTSVVNEMRVRLTARYGRANFDPDRWSDSLSSEQRTDAAALLASLHDPAVRLLNAREAQNFISQMTSTMAPGIGLLELLCIDFAERDGRLTVVTTIPGTPAANSDIRTGDVMVEIDGKATRALSLHQAALALQGESGSSVIVVIDRGGRTLTKTIRRSDFPSDAPLLSSHVVTVESRPVGYLGILRFGPGVGAQAAAAVATLRQQGITALVLDLRNNPGGSVPEAITVAGTFLPDGTPIAEVNRRGKIAETFRSKGDAIYEGPLVVLQNAGSASAAEVVAGALRAFGRAKLVGERSFGKGLVHAMERLPDQSVLMLPVGRLITPDGVDILAHGVMPDKVAVDKNTPVIQKRAASKDDFVFNTAVRMLRNAIVAQPDPH